MCSSGRTPIRCQSNVIPLNPSPSVPVGRRRFTAAAVPDLVAPPWYISRPRSMGPNDSGYKPNDDLYDGNFYELDPDDDESQIRDDIPESDLPLYSSSRHNIPPAHHVSDRSTEIITMLQKQQQLLHQLSVTQKKMQSKQEEFDKKIKELVAKQTDSSSSSPDCSKKRHKITRDLSVTCYNLIMYHSYQTREKFQLFMIAWKKGFENQKRNYLMHYILPLQFFIPSVHYRHSILSLGRK